MRADSKMMGFAFQLQSSLGIRRSGDGDQHLADLGFSRKHSFVACWMGGEEWAVIFLRRDFLEFSWNDLIPVLLTEVTKPPELVGTFLNKHCLQY